MDCSRHSSSDFSASASCFIPDRSGSLTTAILAIPPPPPASPSLPPPPRSPRTPRSIPPPPSTQVSRSLTLPSPQSLQSPRAPSSSPLLPLPPRSPRTPPGLPLPGQSSPPSQAPSLPSFPLPPSPQTPRSPRQHILSGSNPLFSEVACDNADLRSERLTVMAERLAVALQREHAARECVMKATLNWYNEVTRLLLPSASPNSSPPLPLDSSRTLRGQNTFASLASKGINDALYSAPYYPFYPTRSSVHSLDSSRTLRGQNTLASLASKGINDALYSAPYYPFYPTRSSSHSTDSTRASISQYTSNSLASKAIDDSLYTAPYYQFLQPSDHQALNKLPFDLEADGVWKDGDTACLTKILEDWASNYDKNQSSHDNLLSHLASHGNTNKRTVRFDTSSF